MIILFVSIVFHQPLSDADNLGILKEATSLEEYITVVNNSSNNLESSKLSMKKKMENTVALYSAVKRIKSGRKLSLQLPENRELIKNQRIHKNIENSQVNSKIKSSRRSIKATTVQKILPKFIRQSKKETPRHQQLMVTTKIIKQGTKRLKVLSQKIIKTKPEIGESSKTTMNNEELLKKRTKGLIFPRLKRQTVKNEQTKQRITSKINGKI